LALQTAGVDRVTLTQGGNQLLGDIVDKSARLYVQGGQTTTTLLGSSPVLTVRNNASGADVRIQISDNIANSADVGLNQGSLYFATAGAERARIDSGGYFKASNTGTYPIEAITGNNAAGAGHQFNSNENSSTVVVNNGNTGAAVVNTNSFLAVGSTGRHYQGVTNGTTVYQVLANGNVQNTNNSYGAISDIKLKENITDATPKLENLNKLRVVNYNLKADESKLKQIGLIAQEVEAIFPGLVESTPDTVEVTKTRTVEVPAVLDEDGNEVTPATTTEETYTEREPNGEVTKAVKYSVLVPMLLKAVQELTARVAELEAK
jgi:hypothetical protein